MENCVMWKEWNTKFYYPQCNYINQIGREYTHIRLVFLLYIGENTYFSLKNILMLLYCILW